MRLAGTFLARFPAPPGRQVFIPNPTTEEDATALRDAGLEIRHYRFLDRKNGGVDFDGLKEDLGVSVRTGFRRIRAKCRRLQSAPEKSAVLLFVSGSIPTGTELTNAQWKILITILKASLGGRLKYLVIAR
jgi:aspartate aminotransferase